MWLIATIEHVHMYKQANGFVKFLDPGILDLVWLVLVTETRGRGEELCSSIAGWHSPVFLRPKTLQRWLETH